MKEADVLMDIYWKNEILNTLPNTASPAHVCPNGVLMIWDGWKKHSESDTLLFLKKLELCKCIFRSRSSLKDLCWYLFGCLQMADEYTVII